MSTTQTTVTLFPLPTLLTVLFIGLKLTHYIAWSWWWVLAPMWLGLAIVLGVLIVAFIISIIVMAIAAIVGAGIGHR